MKFDQFVQLKVRLQMAEKKRNVKSFVLQMYICKLGYTQEFTINKISFELSNKNVICKSTKDYSLMLKKNDNS